MMLNNSDSLVVCENLVRIYKVADLEVVALQGLDLIVKRGEMLGIVGNSGSGKTTLMNILGGLDFPSAGKVSVDGIDLLNLSGRLLNDYQRKKVGFVWQQTSRNLIPYLSAQENIELPMTMAWSDSTRQKRNWSSELLNAVGLYERRDHKLTQLSGGEQQRIAIAVALANRPVLLLGDEPTGEVDSTTAQAIMDTFRRLGKLMDLTIIIVTHDPRIARQVDRVVAIRDGKISTEIIRQVGRRESSPFLNSNSRILPRNLRRPKTKKRSLTTNMLSWILPDDCKSRANGWKSCRSANGRSLTCGIIPFKLTQSWMKTIPMLVKSLSRLRNSWP